MTLILLALFYLFFPIFILYLCHKFPIVNKIGAVLLAYGFGLLLGNIGILPEGSGKVQDFMTMITIL